MDILEAYQKVNKSFKRKYIFNFGSQAGFYSELNNMIFGMIYCFKYKYQFVLYSQSSAFKIQQGWTDFFEPFCEEVDGVIYKKFNKRTQHPALITLKDKIQWKLYRLKNKHAELLTFELFHKFYNSVFEKEFFDFPELSMKGNLRQVSSCFLNMVYRFNATTLIKINELIDELSIPQHFIGVHIRRGDKNTEFEYQNLDAYTGAINKGIEVLGHKNIFLFTDDYSVVEEMKIIKPTLHFFTFAQKENLGYVHADFAVSSKEIKISNLIKMFASIELISRADIAIGTYTTNPGLFFGMRRNDFISVQKNSWYQFEYDDVKPKV